MVLQLFNFVSSAWSTLSPVRLLCPLTETKPGIAEMQFLTTPDVFVQHRYGHVCMHTKLLLEMKTKIKVYRSCKYGPVTYLLCSG